MASIPIDLVPPFLAVAELGSFSAAAARLGVEKSSASRAVARLEDVVGDRLFLRTTRRVSLTGAGQAARTRIKGRTARASGDLIEVSGRVLTTDGTPQPNARIELWQANAAGRYAHPNDKRADVPLDPNFQGYADLRTDAQGSLRFLTVKPGPYPAGSFKRAPHIHLDVRGRRQRLITQLYFRGDTSLHDQDKVLQHDAWGKSPRPSTFFAELQRSATRLDARAAHYAFDIVLHGTG